MKKIIFKASDKSKCFNCNQFSWGNKQFECIVFYDDKLGGYLVNKTIEAIIN